MKLKIPHTFVLIFSIIVVVTVATYFVPAGQFERVENPDTGVVVIDPDSYERIEQSPVPITGIFTSIPTGMGEVGWIVFLIFIIGGSFGMINRTGAIEAGISKLVLSLRNKEKLLIPITLLIFSLGGATFGMAESTLIFIPMGVVLARSLGMDAITGMAIVFIGAMAGFSGGFLNPFTVGVAQGIAGLPLFSGLGLRIIIQLTLVAIASWYIIAYSEKVKKNPNHSLVYDLEKDSEIAATIEDVPFTLRHKLVLLVVAAGFGLIIYGVFNGWSTSTDLAAIFLAVGILSGLIGGNTPSELADHFIDGAKELTYGALIVGLARAIVVVLNDGQIMDTIIHSSAQLLSWLPGYLSATGMYFFQVLFNFFVPSGSGQAATTIPIMAPLGELLGVSRQSVVLAYQLGDGFTNALFPTSAILMAGLSIAKIPYEKWVRWVMPLMLWWILAGASFMVISVLIGYGPY
ncbi:YfcC family protein [Virgibacillus sp. W0430]|uniref:YfcC family protein n=1 Tax=Virgibacillus sp. W0430 TaxID=3391580 RepID=UPI003F4675D6